LTVLVIAKNSFTMLVRVLSKHGNAASALWSLDH